MEPAPVGGDTVCFIRGQRVRRFSHIVSRAENDTQLGGGEVTECPMTTRGRGVERRGQKSLATIFLREYACQ